MIYGSLAAVLRRQDRVPDYLRKHRSEALPPNRRKCRGFHDEAGAAAPMAHPGRGRTATPSRDRHVERSVRLRARFFPARILAFRLEPTLLRARRGRSPFCAAGAFAGAEALPLFVLVRRDG